MSSKSFAREIIFFVLVFLLFYLGCKLSIFWKLKYPNINSDISLLVVGAAVSGTLFGIFYLAKMNHNTDNYASFKISSGALCRGGSYMFQGDDAQAKFCRDLAKTPEGKCEISKFNCPNGFVGKPKAPSTFTSNSDSCWSGVRCKNNNIDKSHYDKKHGKDCKCGPCSMWTNEYSNTCK